MDNHKNNNKVVWSNDGVFFHHHPAPSLGQYYIYIYIYIRVFYLFFTCVFGHCDKLLWVVRSTLSMCFRIFTFYSPKLLNHPTQTIKSLVYVSGIIYFCHATRHCHLIVAEFVYKQHPPASFFSKTPNCLAIFSVIYSIVPVSFSLYLYFPH